MNAIHFCLAVCLLLSSGPALLSAPLLFTNEANFQTAAAAAGIQLKLDGFEDLPTGFQNGPLVRDGYRFNSRENRTFIGGLPEDGTDGTRNLLISPSRQPAEFLFDSPVQAFAVDVRDALNILGGEFIVNIDRAGPLTLFSGRRGSRQLEFAGILDLAGFSRLAFDSTDLPDSFSMDRVRYGVAEAPEPSTTALLAAGLALLSILSRQRHPRP